MFVSGFMLFLGGGRGEARCFGEVEIVFEVDQPPPPPFQAFLEINWTKGELKRLLDHRPLRSCFTINLQGTTLPFALRLTHITCDSALDMLNL